MQIGILDCSNCTTMKHPWQQARLGTKCYVKRWTQKLSLENSNCNTYILIRQQSACFCLFLFVITPPCLTDIFTFQVKGEGGDQYLECITATNIFLIFMFWNPKVAFSPPPKFNKQTTPNLKWSRGGRGGESVSNFSHKSLPFRLSLTSLRWRYSRTLW